MNSSVIDIPLATPNGTIPIGGGITGAMMPAATISRSKRGMS